MPAGSDAGQLAALALEVAREAAALVAERRAGGVVVFDTKSSDTDIVTEADRASEELIRGRILAVRPDDGFVGEEGDDVAGSSGVQWVVDPIDGTVNYFLGLPNYAVSVAATRSVAGPAEVDVAADTVAGVVLNPATGEEYVGVLGAGATCNGVPLQARPARPLSRAVVSTGFSYEPDIRARQAGAVARLLTEVADIRRFGSCALDICAVAAGRSDGYVEEGVRPWDHAAAGLVAREAGARVEVSLGASGRSLVTAAPQASFDDFRALVARCGFGPGDPGDPARGL